MKRMSIDEIADRELASLPKKEKKYLFEHPNYSDHHFGYGMYLRNEYIHSGILDTGDENGIEMLFIPDDMSEIIFKRIIEKLKEK